MTATALKNQNRERASHLARKLNMETDEFLNMVTAFVLDTVELTVSEHNALILPLEVEIRSQPILPDSPRIADLSKTIAEQDNIL